MPSYKTAQRRVRHRGRDFHFVSYEGQVANPRKEQLATEPTWYLMTAGKRWAVAPHVVGQEEEALDVVLTEWLDENVFVPRPTSPRAPRPPKRAR